MGGTEGGGGRNAPPANLDTVKSATRISFVAGGVLLLAAWAVGIVGLPAAYGPLVDVLPEALAALALLLAWRFRRSRLAIATAVVATAGFLLRGPLAGLESASFTSAETAALATLLPLNLAAVALLGDRPLLGIGPLLHLGAVVAQPWLVRQLLSSAAAGPSGAAAGWAELLSSPQTPVTAFLVASALALLALIFRNAPFEVGLMWALAACALAVLGPLQGSPPALALTAAQLMLLFAFLEASYRLAFDDELTGLPGRRSLEEALTSLGGTYSLAMIDIDHFKRFNDRFGHAAGDQVLRMLAAELGRVGGGGRAYRYGGEEFTLLFPGVEAREARAHLEELRRTIAERRFNLRSPNRPRKKPRNPPRRASQGRQVRIAVSIGVAGPKPSRPSPAEVLRAADRALYRAKRAGRNRVSALLS